MTQKDYILIAQVLKDTQPDPSYYAGNPGGWLAADEQWSKTVKAFMARLHQDNPRFSKLKFLKACGYDTREAEHAI